VRKRSTSPRRLKSICWLLLLLLLLLLLALLEVKDAPALLLLFVVWCVAHALV
jgi:hypothetical protein